MWTGTLSGKDRIEALDVELVRTNQGIIDGLASFDPVITPTTWHRILQGTEELFNFATEPLDDEAAHHRFVQMPLAIDARLIEKNPGRYARLNRTMVGAYRRAIAKEVGREHLLKGKLKLNVAHHYVVSRFPVLTDDPAIIPFLALEDAIAQL